MRILAASLRADPGIRDAVRIIGFRSPGLYALRSARELPFGEAALAGGRWSQWIFGVVADGGDFAGAGAAGLQEYYFVGSFLVRFRAKTAIASGDRGFSGSFWRKNNSLLPRDPAIRADRGFLWRERGLLVSAAGA